jgi:hypothetical protein
MGGFRRMWTIAAGSALGFCGALNAAQAAAPKLPNRFSVWR